MGTRPIHALARDSFFHIRILHQEIESIYIISDWELSVEALYYFPDGQPIARRQSQLHSRKINVSQHKLGETIPEDSKQEHT